MSEHEQKLDEFEQQLRAAMMRVEAPSHFMQTVVLTAEAEARKTPGRAKVLGFPLVPSWAAGAVAAVLVVGVLGLNQVRDWREQRQVETQQRLQAQREFETATQITDRALEHTREQLARAGIRPED